MADKCERCGVVPDGRVVLYPVECSFTDGEVDKLFWTRWYCRDCMMKLYGEVLSCSGGG